MASGGVVVPWEHWVCTRCLKDNKYAVWLIKLKCFKPRHRQHNYSNNKTLVSIDSRTMELVHLRPMPSCARTLRGKFGVCRYDPKCSGDSCKYAHSPVEQDTWNFKKILLEGLNNYKLLSSLLLCKN